MLRFFAKQVTTSTTVVIASTAVAHGAYTAGESACDYGSDKYDQFKKSSSLFRPLSKLETEECARIASTQFNY